MTSADLMKKQWVRYKSNTSKNSYQSPDFHFCMNRVNPDGSTIDNPYQVSDPYHSNSTAANLSCTQLSRRPQSAPQGGRSGGDTARERRGGGYPSASPDKGPATSPSGKNMRPGHTAEMRGYGKRADVPEWPRDWARSGGSGHAYASCGVGEQVTRFKTAPPPRSEGSSVVSGAGAGRGSQPRPREGGGDPRSPTSNRQPRDARPRSSNKRR